MPASSATATDSELNPTGPPANLWWQLLDHALVHLVETVGVDVAHRQGGVGDLPGDGGRRPAPARSRAPTAGGCWRCAACPARGGRSPARRALTDEQLRLLIKACSGKEFMDRRDEAIVRLMAETGLRAGEVLAMQLADVDLQQGRAIVRRGKGGKGRAVPFGPQTAAAVDRYIRARRTHRLSSTGGLWLGGGGQTFSYHGLNLALKRRARPLASPGSIFI